MKKNIIPLLTVVIVVSLILAGCASTPPQPVEPKPAPPEQLPEVPEEPSEAPQPEPTTTPMPETGCPISCSADKEGWNLVFECEEEGQTIDQHFIEQGTEYELYGVPFFQYHAVIDYEFKTSGNKYHAIVYVSECVNTPTGYCIIATVTGDTLGDKKVTCTNY